jgi:hypothetical protein
MQSNLLLTLTASFFGIDWGTVKVDGISNWLIFGFAIFPPIGMLLARSEIRLLRLRAILDFIISFDLMTGGSEKSDQRMSGKNPSVEFVKSKYVSDLRSKFSESDKGAQIQETEEQSLRRFIQLAEKPWRNIPLKMLFSSLPFMCVSFFGFQALLLVFTSHFLAPDPTLATDELASHNLLVIAALTFAGAYIAAIRMLLRSLAIFNLSSFTFLRQATELIFSVILVILIYKAFPDPFFNLGNALTGTVQTVTVTPDKTKTEGDKPQDATATKPQTPAPVTTQVFMERKTSKEIPWIWYALAPVLGLLPTSSSKFLLMKLQSFVSWIKISDDRFIPVTKILTLDIIDGIDFETRFFLEEVGIYDVQNLATFNPVMLHIEAGYGIYECIDWISQAQLCHIVGPEKFLMFREVNIRTIFDLERAIDSIYSSDVYDEIYSAILFAPTANMRKTSEISNFKFMITDENGSQRLVSVEEYCQWIQKKLWKKTNPNDPQPNANDENAQKNERLNAIEYLMVWISDDLHVRRLRRLWIDISKSLGPESEYFDDSKRKRTMIKREENEPDDAAKQQPVISDKQEPEPAQDVVGQQDQPTAENT